MADEAPELPPPPATGTAWPLATAPAVQLIQVRAPIEDAARVLGAPDEYGRQPIVMVPEHSMRIRNDLVMFGLIGVVVALLLDISLPARGGLVLIGIALLVAGTIRALFVSVPEGAQAILLRRGRFLQTVGPGVHVVRPGIVVSHFVSTRDTPFDAPAIEVPTLDDVRTYVDVLVTFRIAAPERFVFTISAADFDQVCQATCQEAVRLLVRARDSTAILDLGEPASNELRDAIGERLAEYGIEVVRAVLTHVMPPLSFVQTREARRLANLRRAEEQELHALNMLRESDRQELTRQLIRARREEIALEAENEADRLERLEARIRKYPAAMQWTVESQRLEVARALAANSRAMLQVGAGNDIAGALLMQTSGENGIPSVSPAPPSPTPRRSRSTAPSEDASER